MKLKISASLNYRLPQPVDLMLQIEAANGGGQHVLDASLDLGEPDHMSRVSVGDGVCEPIWLRATGTLCAAYRAVVAVDRPDIDLSPLAEVPPHRLPADAIPYLNESRYCPSNKFHAFVERRFGELDGGAKIARMRDWIESRFTIAAGSSDTETGALDSFVERRGVCRDYAHVMIALARAAHIPARMASVYALGVDPQDFHAVHLGHANVQQEKIGRVSLAPRPFAADISFLTAYRAIEFLDQSVQVERADAS